MAGEARARVWGAVGLVLGLAALPVSCTGPGLEPPGTGNDRGEHDAELPDGDGDTGSAAAGGLSAGGAGAAGASPAGGTGGMSAATGGSGGEGGAGGVAGPPLDPDGGLDGGGDDDGGVDPVQMDP